VKKILLFLVQHEDGLLGRNIEVVNNRMSCYVLTGFIVILIFKQISVLHAF
jgi:hypothetical protein